MEEYLVGIKPIFFLSIDWNEALALEPLGWPLIIED